MVLMIDLDAIKMALTTTSSSSTTSSATTATSTKPASVAKAQTSISTIRK